MFFGKVKRANILTFLLIIGGLSVFTIRRTISPRLEPKRPNRSRIVVDRGLAVVNEAPTRRFRDNLRNDSNYITCWTNAGFTNQFMNYVNMIYLSTLTDRIPIIPPFAPDHHISASAGVVPFGDIFDLNPLRERINKPILEWRDVKELPEGSGETAYSTSEVEDLGCWTTRKENSDDPTRAVNLVHHLGVDVSYTRVPGDTRFNPSDREEEHVVLPQLAALVYPQDPMVRVENLRNSVLSPGRHSSTPENQLACFDTLYYATSGTRRFEWEYSWSPAWREVGRHLGFTAKMQNLAQNYLMDAFAMDSRILKDVPPFIAVHIRRGDFRVYTADSTQDDPFPPLSAYKRHVDAIKNEFRIQHGLDISHVLVSSDETSPLFWKGVRQEGWFYSNHSEQNTLGRYGEWYPAVIDVAIQSLARGFVGTHGSTYSLISQKRVEVWNGGMAREVNFADGR